MVLDPLIEDYFAVGRDEYNFYDRESDVYDVKSPNLGVCGIGFWMDVLGLSAEGGIWHQEDAQVLVCLYSPSSQLCCRRELLHDGDGILDGATKLQCGGQV